MNRLDFKSCIVWITCLCSAGLTAQSVIPELYNKKILVQPSIPLASYAFDVHDVKLSPSSPFHHARSMDSAYLAIIDPFRLLTRFYINAGLAPKDSLYGGWENSGLSGHTLGHYLSAASMMYAATGSKKLKNNIDILISELHRIQIKRKSGYLGAIPLEDTIFNRVKRGVIVSSGFDLNGGWSPWYTVHKIMAGLCDAYLYTDNKDALNVVVRMADWVDETISGLSDSLRLQMLNCEYGGMNEVLANIYSMTENKKYLRLSYKFYDDFVMGRLAKGIDPLPGKHSNTNVPKAIGSARQYELSGRIGDKDIASNFWNYMVYHHTYSIGGNSNYEYCGERDKLNDRLSDNTCETCNTYNMLKLTRHLFAWNVTSAYMDYYERALYNHILASQNPTDGMMTYFVPLRSGTKKQFSDTFNTFTCCVGSGMENHSKYQEQIYSHDGRHTLFVNLFIPSEVKWQANHMTAKLMTQFPKENIVRILINSKPGPNTVLAVRHPFWSKNTSIKINHTKADYKEHDGYLYIHHPWKLNDVVEVTLDQLLYEEPMPDNPDRVSIKYGPLVLAADLGNLPPGELSIPVIINPDRNPDSWTKKLASAELEFHIDENHALPQPIRLKPFYALYDVHYNVYFDHMTKRQWDLKVEAYEAEQKRIKELESRTIDLIHPGNKSEEQSHHLTHSERSYTDEALGKTGREARVENYFQFELKVDPTRHNQLVCTYLGDDKNRQWDMLIDGVLFTTVEWNEGETGKFYDRTYDIPGSLIKGKEMIMIKVLANHGKTAGRLFGARTVFID